MPGYRAFGFYLPAPRRDAKGVQKNLSTTNYGMPILR